VSATDYFSRVSEIISTIQRTQAHNIQQAADLFVRSLKSGGRVYLFGSGHSVIPVLDIFPRYGSFVGFFPIYDPRLMWSNITGPGGVRELLWLERQEGYARIILSSYDVDTRDSFLIFSHGGLNAAPIDMAIEAGKKGAAIVSVSSHQNYRKTEATHSSGKKLPDMSTVAIDNCVPPEDALIASDGMPEKFAAGSTVAAVSIAMALVAETGVRLAQSGQKPSTFASPNSGLPANHNDQVFENYVKAVAKRRG
jgi:uncharacterized phosphosugar-binding protein